MLFEKLVHLLPGVVLLEKKVKWVRVLDFPENSENEQGLFEKWVKISYGEVLDEKWEKLVRGRGGARLPKNQ